MPGYYMFQQRIHDQSGHRLAPMKCTVSPVGLISYKIHALCAHNLGQLCWLEGRVLRGGGGGGC